MWSELPDCHAKPDVCLAVCPVYSQRNTVGCQKDERKCFKKAFL